jgi:ATP-dependent DNA ligase
VWAFDLLHQNRGDLRDLPLIERKARLEKLIIAAKANWLRHSESFDEHREMAVASVLGYLRSEPDSGAKTRAADRQAVSAVPRRGR